MNNIIYLIPKNFGDKGLHAAHLKTVYEHFSVLINFEYELTDMHVLHTHM